ncbi:fimbrial protein [Cedecea sp.]|jgi:type 1 fimbria pilin|uniref:fimbrial protein n=1 Tax=Cedecea sp. TaxID=1970739 RepID=UPI002F3F8C5F
MAYKKLMVSSMVGLFMASTGAMAADQGQGQIRFIGSIIESPCSIDPDKTTQEVNFGQVSSAFLNSTGAKSGPEEVIIELKDCTLSGNGDDDSVKVTFSGQQVTDETYLNVSGVDGVGVTMVDWQNTAVKWGATPANAHSITAGRNTLNYNAYLEKLPNISAITTGDFVAITNFTLAYE